MIGVFSVTVAFVPLGPPKMALSIPALFQVA
jgi:hypothetical protein